MLGRKELCSPSPPRSALPGAAVKMNKLGGRWKSLPCARCGNIEPIYVCGGGRRYCKNCADDVIGGKCAECGKPIQNQYKFCSKRCGLLARWRKTAVFITCQWCGKVVRCHPSSADGKFCSRKCQGDSQRGRQAPWMLTEKAVAQRIKMLRATRKQQSAKMAGRIRTDFGSAKGPDHRRARHAAVRDPQRRVFKVDNIADFVRRNPKLFSAKDRRPKPPGKSKYGHQRAIFVSLASQGLSQIIRGSRGSWKGWTLVEVYDR
jgi:predicted nucleic acid-binding Zn ribbon protein